MRFLIETLGSTPLYDGRGQYPIILGGLDCSGLEASLLECDRNDRSIIECTLDDVVAIKCEGTKPLPIIYIDNHKSIATFILYSLSLRTM